MRTWIISKSRHTQIATSCNTIPTPRCHCVSLIQSYMSGERKRDLNLCICSTLLSAQYSCDTWFKIRIECDTNLFGTQNRKSIWYHLLLFYRMFCLCILYGKSNEIMQITRASAKTLNMCAVQLHRNQMKRFSTNSCFLFASLSSHSGIIQVSS